MHPVTRKKLERNIEYHAAMADYHKAELEAKQAANPDAQGASAEQDADSKMADVHAEAAKQLQDVLNNEPLAPAITVMQAERTLSRNLSNDLRPNSGAFH